MLVNEHFLLCFLARRIEHRGSGGVSHRLPERACNLGDAQKNDPECRSEANGKARNPKWMVPRPLANNDKASARQTEHSKVAAPNAAILWCSASTASNVRISSSVKPKHG